MLVPHMLILLFRQRWDLPNTLIAAAVGVDPELIDEWVTVAMPGFWAEVHGPRLELLRDVLTALDSTFGSDQVLARLETLHPHANGERNLLQAVHDLDITSIMMLTPSRH